MTKKDKVTPVEARSMANLISGKMKVRITEGKNWAYDYDDKAISYRKEDLGELTETDVVANLLHEAGHAKYSSDPEGIDYGNEISETDRFELPLLVDNIEDFRIEDLTREYYPYAKNFLPENGFKTRFALNQYAQEYADLYNNIPKFLQYCIGACNHLGNDDLGYDLDEDVQQAIKETKKALDEARQADSTQEVANVVGEKVYPKIKDWLPYDDEKAQKASVNYTDGTEVPPYEDLYPDVKPLINRTATSLSKVLNEKQFDKFGGKYRRGDKLNQRRLYRFGTNDYKLFQRRVVAEARDYIFALVIDESGSMQLPIRGNFPISNIANAIRGAILFSHVLKKLRIKFTLHGFNSEIHHYKETPTTDLPNSKVFQRMKDEAYDVYDNASFNNDGQAINEVAERLLKYDGRQVAFILSDGRPAPTRAGEKFPLTPEIKKAQHKGIELVGIGIGHEHQVDKYYDNHIIVPKVSELPKAIVKGLKNKL